MNENHLRVIAWDRENTPGEPCDKGTPGCCIDHATEERIGAVGETECETW